MPLDVATLFRENHIALYRYLLRLTGDDATAKDAVQTAFLRMLEAPPDGSNPRAWLYRVATNVVRERGRTERRRQQLVEARGYAAGLGDPPRDPTAHLEQRETEERLRWILESLDPRDRTVLLMREEGFSHREIAKAVGTTTGSVGTMIARALKKTQQLFAEEAS